MVNRNKLLMIFLYKIAVTVNFFKFNNFVNKSCYLRITLKNSIYLYQICSVMKSLLKHIFKTCYNDFDKLK